MPRPGIVLLIAIACACLAAQVPDSADDRAILDEGRQNALAFTDALPDFICIQLIRRFQSPAGTYSWAQTDRLAAQLSYSGGGEDYHLVSIDDRPTNQPYHAVAGTITSGEFGSWLHSVFDPDSAGEFHLEGRATARERPVVVFSYTVERNHSHYDLSYRDAPDHVASATVGYHGRVYIDVATKCVTRLEIDAGEIPAKFPLQHSSIVLEYTFTDIAGRQYLLPLYAETRIATAKLDYRNEIEFQGYRKFEASSTMLDDASTKTSNKPESANDSGSTGPARLPDDWPIFPPPVEPSAEERRAALEEARRAAVDYLASLPPFVCIDVFRISTSQPGQSWKSRGVVTGEIRHREGGADSFEPRRFDEDATANATEFDGALSAMGS